MRRTIQINKEYERLRTFVERIPETMETEGAYIYGGRRNLIMMMTAPDGTLLNVKRFCKPSLLNNIVYSTGLRQPKGRRAFDYPARLLAKGIETPEAVAYIEERNGIGLLQQCYFVSRQCTYSHRLYEMGDALPEVYEPMATALARFAAHMHDEGVLHRDFSPGNVLWEKTENTDSTTPTKGTAPYRFSVVDINRLRFGPVSMADGCMSFARLWGPKRFIQLLVEEYALQRGFDGPTCVAITMKARAKFWQRYQRKREMEFKLEL